MFLQDLDDVKRLFASLHGTFSGVGMTAYSRIIPAYLIQPYHIIALRKTRDLPLLRKKAKIFCLEEETGRFVEEKEFNSARLLAHPLIKKFLKGLPDPKYLLLYQNYPELEALAVNEGWSLLANPSSLRVEVAQRAFFHRMIDHLKLKRIPGGIYPTDELFSCDYEYWTIKIAPRFVAQVPEILQGGGRGTFFINSREDYQDLRDKLKGGTFQGKKIKGISIHKFIEGIPASLALCLTRCGILVSNLQRQLIDLPFCRDISGDGVFCGHSWGKTPWPSFIKDEAIGQARLIGEYLAGLGYKGIIGLDFLVDGAKGHVYPLECNPRFTGAFPMLSQLHLARNVIPMDFFHMLEFLDVPYEIDPVSLNSRYEEPIKGSHIIMFGLKKEIPKGGRLPDAGLYEFDPDTETDFFVAGGTDFREIKNERQFIIIDGPPALPEASRGRAGPVDTGESAVTIKDPHHRLCRILFPCPVVDEKDVLSSQALSVVNSVYRKIFH